MPKFRVQFYGPTIYLEAESDEEAKELAIEYLGDEFPSEEYVVEAEQDDEIPDDNLIER